MAQLVTYQRGKDKYQVVIFDGYCIPPVKHGFKLMHVEARPSCMDTVRGRTNCTAQLRKQTRRQAEPTTYRGGILCSDIG